MSKAKSLEGLSMSELEDVPNYFLRWYLLYETVNSYLHLQNSSDEVKLLAGRKNIIEKYKTFKRDVPDNIRESLRRGCITGPCIDVAINLEKGISS
jgi:hypothetical protein